MKALVIHGHQNPTDSFNRAIADTVCQTLTDAGVEVAFHNLYEENFDPILTAEELAADAPLDPLVQQHCDQLVDADALVVVHPNWWAMPPAILKGWLDRVFRQGLVYRFGPEGVIGQLTGKKALIITSNTPREAELDLYGDPLENLWNACICGFCGITKEDFLRRNFESVVMSDDAERKGWLEDTKQMVTSHLLGQ